MQLPINLSYMNCPDKSSKESDLAKPFGLFCSFPSIYKQSFTAIHITHLTVIKLMPIACVITKPISSRCSSLSNK